MNSPHKGSVTQKMFPFDGVIMRTTGMQWTQYKSEARNNADISLIWTMESSFVNLWLIIL